MRLGYILFLLNLTACVEGLTQVAGTGSTYTVRCSAEMDIQNGNQYFAKCKPDACTGNYRSGPVSHVVVALEPGKRLVGYAERVCIQDLAESSGLFNPGLFPQQEAVSSEGANGDISSGPTKSAPEPVSPEAATQQ